MDVLEIACGAILELDAQEVTDVRRRTTAEFDGKSRSVAGCIQEGQRAVLWSISKSLTNASHLWVLLDNTSLVEERNECLIGGFN
jgi:hypothetical protein